MATAATAATDPPNKKSLATRLHDWGSSSLPPSLLATLVAGLHARPLQPVPLLLVTPPLLGASYLNLAGLPTAAASLAAAWSGLYALLALRRRQPVRAKFSPRGAVRVAAMGLAVANCAAAFLVYLTGDFQKDDEERRRKRWAAAAPDPPA